jgi:hypothetical protein
MATKTTTSSSKAPAGDGLWPYWVSEPPRLVGNPAPFWESHHGGDYFHGDRLGRFAHKTGHSLFGWQWDCERKILATRADGLWTHPDVALIITRQQGKTELVVWRILYGLFYLGEKIVYSAQRWKTVEDVYDRIVAIIDSRPSLKRRLQKTLGCPHGYSKQGNHGEVHLVNGGSLDMGPRTRAVGRGQTKIDLAIFDEAYDIKELNTPDLTGAQNASANPQTIFISTAAVAELHPNCHVLAGMRRNGLRQEPDLYAAEWRAPDGLSRDDPATWRLAQPSHGVTVRAREVGRELRRARTATLRKMFDADYLGWGEWPPDEEDTAPVVSRERWIALVERMPALVGDICIAVERTRDSQWWAVAAGQRTSDGRVHVEVGYWRRANIGQVAAALLELIELWNPAAIVVDAKSKAMPLVPYMTNQDIDITVVTTPKLATYTRGFIDGIESGDITHFGQKILEDAVDTATTRELPRGDIVWDDAEMGTVAAPLKAVTLVHGAVLEYAEEQGPAASPSLGEDIVDLDADPAGIMDVAF